MSNKITQKAANDLNVSRKYANTSEAVFVITDPLPARIIGIIFNSVGANCVVDLYWLEGIPFPVNPIITNFNVPTTMRYLPLNVDIPSDASFGFSFQFSSGTGDATIVYEVYN